MLPDALVAVPCPPVRRRIEAGVAPLRQPV